MRFIHVEIYRDNDPDSGPNPWVQQWALPSEPWVFVVGADGKIKLQVRGRRRAGRARAGRPRRAVAPESEVRVPSRALRSGAWNPAGEPGGRRREPSERRPAFLSGPLLARLVRSTRADDELRTRDAS